MLSKCMMFECKSIKMSQNTISLGMCCYFFLVPWNNGFGLKNFAHALGVMSGVASFTIMKSFYKTEAAILSMQAMLPLTSKPTIAVKRGITWSNCRSEILNPNECSDIEA